MKQLVLVLGLAALALGLTLALFFGREAPAGDASAPSAAQATLREPEGEPLVLEAPPAAAASAKAADAARGELAAVRAPDESGARRDAAKVQALSGVLTLPAGTPDDEQAAVEVHRKRPTLDGFGGAFEALGSGDGQPSLLAQVEPDGQGAFELELGDDLDEVWITARGRYLIAAPERVALPREEPLELAPELGAWITGRVRGPADARVEAEEEWELRLQPDRMAAVAGGNPFSLDGFGEPPRRREATVEREPGSARGRFELRGVRPATGYRLELVPDSLAAARTEPFELRAGEHAEPELELNAGGLVSGLVVDTEGRGLADVRLELTQDPFMFGQGGFEVRRGETGPDGRFELAHVRAGALTIQAQRDGFLDRRAQVELAPGGRVEGVRIELDDGERIAGWLRWPDGTPAPEVEIDVEFDPSFLGGMEAMNAMRGREGEGETDANGHFVVTGLGKGPFVVRAEAERPRPEGLLEDSGEAVEWVARAAAVRPNGPELELVLEPPLGVAGLVVDDLGQPITNFAVRARTKTSGLLSGVGAESTEDEFESPEGRFFLDGLRPGEWEALASAPGYARGDAVPLSVPQTGDAELVLTLSRAAAVSGTVLDPGGRPIAGAAVMEPVTLGDLERVAVEAQRGEARRATSAADGSFVLEGLSIGSVELIARHPEYAQSAKVAVELAPAERLEGTVLTLRLGGRILGVLFGDDGEPAPGQTILVQDPTLSSGQLFGTTDAKGEFVFEHLAPGGYQVMSFATDMPEGGESADENDFTALFSSMKFTMAEVRDGEDTYVELGAVPTDPVRVKGRLSAAGEGVPGAMVSFLPDGAGGGRGLESLKFTTSGADGRFELELAAPGRYMVNVQQVAGTGQQQSVEFLREVPEVEQHELELTLPVGRVTGRVLGPDGRPLANARVSLAADGPIANGSFTGGNYAELWTGEDGRYELRWLRPGRYSVAAGGAFLGGLFGDTGEATYGRQVRRIELDEGQHKDGIDFRLETPGGIAGRVLDLGGRPVAEAAIFLRDDEGNPVDRISMVTTNAAGRFEYTSLEPGTYQVQARSKTEVSALPASVRVRAGESSEVELALDEGTVLVVSLSDKEGNPVRCRVEVTDEAGHQVNGMWSFADLMQVFSGSGYSSDEQRVGPLPPGKYKIEATADDGRDARKILTLSGQSERPIKLRLD